MKKGAVAVVVGIILGGASQGALAGGEILTGTPRLACEAMLCLSSGQRPDECTPSLRKYFSIDFSNPLKTIRERANFLNQCPVVRR